MSEDKYQEDDLAYYENKYGKGQYDYFEELSDDQVTKKINYSIINKFTEESKVDDEFLFKLDQLKLEDIIALKLELINRSFSGKMFGLPLWNRAKEIMREAMTKFAVSISDTIIDAANVVGISSFGLKNAIDKYDIDLYFDDHEEHRIDLDM